MPDRDWFEANGCELTRPDIRIFFAVFQMSNGNPCRECNCKSTCPAWAKMQSGASVQPTRHGSGHPLCPKCKSPVNLDKAKRLRGGKCVCGQVMVE